MKENQKPRLRSDGKGRRVGGATETEWDEGDDDVKQGWRLLPKLTGSI